MSRLARLGAGNPYLWYRVGAALARLVPAGMAPGVATIGALAYQRRMHEQRAMARRHLQRSHGPGLRGRALDREVRRLFASYARYWLESARIPGTPPARLDADTTYEGVEHLEQALAAGKGVIMALPHLGGWDYGGAWFAAVGRYPVTVVVEPVEPPELLAWFTELRRSVGLEIVPLGPDAATKVLRRLRSGGVVGLLSDRDILGTGTEVEFFGERTTLPSGPATLAFRTGAAILPTAVYFTGRRGHHGVVRPPIAVERRGRFGEDTARVTQLLANELEALIRMAPSQWHLLQPNWPSDRKLTGNA
ncbi:MAG: phosphatidylinositol mannoside acyltransferase [Actinomycetota bacterium]|nr:phosphatidylinositol mannoside acyltransferase [Actinomycetota bacterium]